MANTLSGRILPPRVDAGVPGGAQAASPLAFFYEEMRLIATVEERLLSLFSEGLVAGTVHTCLGQEACAVGVVSAIDPDRDIIFSNHRCHGHYLAYCGDVEGLIAEILGRETGVCRGIGGSQHLHHRNFYSNGIQGGIVPVATGMALAEKCGGSGAIAVVFLGDGTMGQGIVYESLNVAALWRLPVLFVVEDNGYAQSTPRALQHAGRLESRGDSFGIGTTVVDATDVLAVHAAATAAVETIRSDCFPAILHLHTYRLAAHSKGDDLRDPAEIAAARSRQPLVQVARDLDPAWCRAVDSRVRDRVEAAVAQALASPVAYFGTKPSGASP